MQFIIDDENISTVWSSLSFLFIKSPKFSTELSTDFNLSSLFISPLDLLIDLLTEIESTGLLSVVAYLNLSKL